MGGWSEFMEELERETGHWIVLDFCDVSRVDRKPAELLVRNLPKHVLLLNCPTGSRTWPTPRGCAGRYSNRRTASRCLSRASSLAPMVSGGSAEKLSSAMFSLSRSRFACFCRRWPGCGGATTSSFPRRSLRLLSGTLETGRLKPDGLERSFAFYVPPPVGRKCAAGDRAARREQQTARSSAPSPDTSSTPWRTGMDSSSRIPIRLPEAGTTAALLLTIRRGGRESTTWVS